ncbi:hypothetical protein [Bacillus sp. ISL-7]|uniref:hypothetical protein n=1 Tax=Bacillus sp. ISL-7 TaxID=2819136 RepID=UPI001BE69BBE|nr:hypothetical protein [Bacillus sp. ISL-7]MBT2737305.1 hypothetical protein [Bacillus sp. ISL-7]
MILKHFLLYSETDEGIAVVEKSFTFQSRCITSLYEKCFSKFHTENIKQINIFCVKESLRTTLAIVDGFCDVEILYDVSEFIKLKDQEKKEVILDKLKQGIEKVVKLNNWESTPFDVAYNCVKEANFKNEYVWKKPKSSPNRNFKAEVFINHGLYVSDIYLIVKDKNGQEIAKKLVASTKPDEIIFSHYLGELKWLSNYEVAIFNRPNSKYVSVHLKEVFFN